MAEFEKLEMEQIEKLSGGRIYFNRQTGYVDVIDDDGRAVFSTNDFRAAVAYAADHNLPTYQIDARTVRNMQDRKIREYIRELYS